MIDRVGSAFGRLACLLVLTASAAMVDAGGAPLAAAALERTQHTVRYDGAYVAIDYPGGDVPKDVGVCSDVVVRAYRALGIDLQQAVHEDMTRDFGAYPDRWGLSRPDPNIDHRRVPNLETYFARQGAALAVTSEPSRFQPGDVVSWRLPNGLPHIGLVGPNRVPGTQRYLIVHNIGHGPEEADVLLSYELVGHFRYPSVATEP